MTLGIMTLSITTHGSIATVRTMTLSITIEKCDTLHNDNQYNNTISKINAELNLTIPSMNTFSITMFRIT